MKWSWKDKDKRKEGNKGETKEEETKPSPSTPNQDEPTSATIEEEEKQLNKTIVNVFSGDFAAFRRSQLEKLDQRKENHSKVEMSNYLDDDDIHNSNWISANVHY